MPAADKYSTKPAEDNIGPTSPQILIQNCTIAINNLVLEKVCRKSHLFKEPKQLSNSDETKDDHPGIIATVIEQGFVGFIVGW
jgi:hypothetical protein